jgi:glutathione S-transferase
MRVINEFQAYTEAELLRIVGAVRLRKNAKLGDEMTHAMHRRRVRGAHDRGPAVEVDWIVGDAVSAADIAIYPFIQLLHRTLTQPGAAGALRAVPAGGSPLSCAGEMDAAGRSAARLRAYVASPLGRGRR